jgi:predicted site-specific integrase-resolvase
LASRSIWHLFARHSCELLVLNQQSLNPEPERTQDVPTMLHGASRRLSGLRNDRNTVKEALAHGSDRDRRPPDPLESNA